MWSSPVMTPASHAGNPEFESRHVYSFFAKFFLSLRKKKIKLRNGESNPGHLRDRQRCYQLHHIGLLEYLGFDPSTSCLLSTHASDCANTPATPGGFEPPRAEHTHLAGEPLNHSGKVSKAVRASPNIRTEIKKEPLKFQKKIKKTYNTRDSLVVPYQSTDRAQRCLASQFGWDTALSSWYDRMTISLSRHRILCRLQVPDSNKKDIQHPRFPCSPLPKY